MMTGSDDHDEFVPDSTVKVPVGAPADYLRDVTSFEEDVRLLLEKHGVTYMVASWFVAGKADKELSGTVFSQHGSTSRFDNDVLRKTNVAAKLALRNAGVIR